MGRINFELLTIGSLTDIEVIIEVCGVYRTVNTFNYIHLSLIDGVVPQTWDSLSLLVDRNIQNFFLQIFLNMTFTARAERRLFTN